MGKIKIAVEKCKGCGLCVIYCPKGCIALSVKLNRKGIKPAKIRKPDFCTGCSFCAIICPDCAIEVYR